MILFIHTVIFIIDSALRLLFTDLLLCHIERTNKVQVYTCSSMMKGRVVQSPQLTIEKSDLFLERSAFFHTDYQLSCFSVLSY